MTKKYTDTDEIINRLKIAIGMTESEITIGYLEYLISLIEQAPAADVQEVKHSHWEQVSVTDYPCEGVDEISIASMFCPNCKRWSTTVYVYGNPTEHANYCSFCGAKMDGKEKEE